MGSSETYRLRICPYMNNGVEGAEVMWEASLPESLKNT